MKKLLQVIAVMGLFSIVTPMYAGIYAQYIHLKVRQAPLAAYAVSDDVCFTTTDWLDKGYCGNGSSNIYRFGPKNVRMVNKGVLRDAAIDLSCQAFFYSSVRTPEFSGEVKLSASVSHDSQGYIIHSCSMT